MCSRYSRSANGTEVNTRHTILFTAEIRLPVSKSATSDISLNIHQPISIVLPYLLTSTLLQHESNI